MTMICPMISSLLPQPRYTTRIWSRSDGARSASRSAIFRCSSRCSSKPSGAGRVMKGESSYQVCASRGYAGLFDRPAEPDGHLVRGPGIGLDVTLEQRGRDRRLPLRVEVVVVEDLELAGRVHHVPGREPGAALLVVHQPAQLQERLRGLGGRP